MTVRRRLRGWLGVGLASAACLLAACGPANDRPRSGAIPGGRTAAAPPGVPPTLSASDSLTMRALPSPSPGMPSAAGTPMPLPSPSAAPAPSSSPVASPPIVRTIAPAANAHVPSGPVSLSAVLIGRGADLASASMLVDGADAGATIDKRSAREWTIRAGGSFDGGTHSARVMVRDASGGAGGFTWQFSVGDVQ